MRLYPSTIRISWQKCSQSAICKWFSNFIGQGSSVYKSITRGDKCLTQAAYGKTMQY